MLLEGQNPRDGGQYRPLLYSRRLPGRGKRIAKAQGIDLGTPWWQSSPADAVVMPWRNFWPVLDFLYIYLLRSPEHCGKIEQISQK